MKKLIMLQTSLSVLLILFLGILNAQKVYSVKNNPNISVSGTSTMHDWVMNSNSAECKVTLVLDDNKNMVGINDMQFKMATKTLKSGKGAMDSNAYKALKSDKNTHITAKLKKAEVTTKDNKNYIVNAKVLLKIAGTEKETDLIVKMKKINVDSYEIVTSKDISMKEYNVTAPSFMMGAVKTGNDVKLNFNFIIQE